METEQLSETLTKLNNTLDPKSIKKKSNSETLLQLEVENFSSHYYRDKIKHYESMHLPVWGVGEGPQWYEEKKDWLLTKEEE